MLKSKLHRATVTGADLDYEGSIAIDRDLLDLSGILPHEQVDVFDINTGGRFTTYAIEAPRGSRDVAVNGAAARLVQTGDKVIMVAYCQIPAEEARNYHPTMVVLGEGNEVKRAASHPRGGQSHYAAAAADASGRQGFCDQRLFNH